MAIQAFSLFGDVELKTAKLRAGFRDADAQFRQGENRAKSTVRNINNELSKIGQFKSNLNQGFMSAFNIQGGGGAGSLIGNAGGNLLMGGAKALWSHMTDAIDRGMDMKDVIEQMRIAFTGLIGTEEKAVSHMRELFKFGAETPFQIRDVLNYSQALQAVGVDFKDIRQELTDLGDAMAKAGTFNRMDKALLAITQMRSKGRITGEELNQQLSEALPGARGYMARGLGIAQPELNKLLEEGRINAEAALKLMFLQMRKEAAGTMKETATKTIAGITSTLEDAKDMTFAQSVTGNVDPFAPAGGAYAQRRENLLQQTRMFSGPDAQRIAGNVGYAAENYMAAQGYLEKEMFAGNNGRETALKLIRDPKGAAADIWKGLSDGLASGKGSVSEAVDGLSTSMWETWSNFWETNSPSKRAQRMGTWIGEGFRLGLEEQLKDPRVQALLDVIGKGEGTFDPKSGKRIYNKIFGGQQVALGQDHPGIYKKFGNTTTSAAGFGQFLERTWKGASKALGGLDFSNPHHQELAMVYLMKQRGMLDPLFGGDPVTAIKRGGKEWASLPGSPYGQPTQSMSGAMSLYANRLATYSDGAPVSKINPMPVRVINLDGLGSGVGGYSTRVNDPRGGASKLFGSPMAVGGQASILINKNGKPVEISAALDPITDTFDAMIPTANLLLRPLTDVKEVMKEMTGLDAEMAALRKSAITPGEAKEKRDPLFEKAFTREGVAGDFHGGFASLLGNLGWEKPGSLGKQFLLNFARDIQARLANDLASQLTGSLFGNRGEDGKMGGGLLSKLFGSLFGGGRASGGSVSGGRLYMVGERGPELLAMGGGGGHVYNNRETRGMLGGGGDSRTIVAFGDRAIAEAIDAHSRTPKGRRAKIIHARYMRKLVA